MHHSIADVVGGLCCEGDDRRTRGCVAQLWQQWWNDSKTTILICHKNGLKAAVMMMMMMKDE